MDRVLKIRAAGLIRTPDNAILLHKKVGDDFWNAPGGKVEEHENAKECIIREIKEELNWKINRLKYIGILENFFSFNQKKYKELVFYFEIESFQGEINFKEKTIQEKGEKYIFKFFNNREMGKITIKPNIFKEIINQKTHPFYLINIDK